VRSNAGVGVDKKSPRLWRRASSSLYRADELSIPENQQLYIAFINHQSLNAIREGEYCAAIDLEKRFIPVWLPILVRPLLLLNFWQGSREFYACHRIHGYIQETGYPYPY
jgi:hypothetical protein